MAEKRIDIQYRGHRIIANLGGAMVYPEKHPIDGSSQGESLANAKAFIDAKYNERQKKRTAPHIGTVDDYAEALAALKLGAHERAMLSAHYRAEGRRLTATQLAESAGWDGFSSANSHYGRLGKRVAEHVELDLKGRDDEAWTQALAEFDEDTRQWTMHDDLAKALLRLNIV
ncbi:hypothetical protein GCM10009069_30160 [Algimonas arctica]|uniref:Uncharacterized protein n=1 Tax=Algimonas arctica TaxID=1479486 RepID=A0A8J3CTU7_9PROT|nr:hypothetical protein [Algimonas arctica]GHB05784.1 hypothetical protein GCM10009069_30160 [Algimonas arctica]